MAEKENMAIRDTPDSEIHPNDALDAVAEIISALHLESPGFIDVGAHEGETLSTVEKWLTSGSKYFALEPNPRVLPILRLSVETVRKARGLEIELIEAAAGPKTGNATFRDTQGSVHSGLLRPANGLSERVPAGSHEILHEFEVPILTVDQLLKQRSEPFVLKVDAEGYDLEVLKGASNSLEQHQLAVVISEVFFVSYRHSQAYFWDIAGFMADFGYQFVNLFDTRNTSQGRLYTGNGVWVSPKVADSLGYL